MSLLRPFSLSRPEVGSVSNNNFNNTESVLSLNGIFLPAEFSYQEYLREYSLRPDSTGRKTGEGIKKFPRISRGKVNKSRNLVFN